MTSIVEKHSYPSGNCYNPPQILPEIRACSHAVTCVEISASDCLRDDVENLLSLNVATLGSSVTVLELFGTSVLRQLGCRITDCKKTVNFLPYSRIVT